jgi:hypothetical protein
VTERYKSNAKRAAAAARALHVRVIELEAGTFDGLDVIDLDAVQVHRTHLVDRDLEAVKIHHLIGLIGLVFECHVILETGAASSDDGNAQRHRHRILHAHDFLDLGAGSGSQTNHKILWPPLAGKPAMLFPLEYSKPFLHLHIRDSGLLSCLETPRSSAFRQPYNLVIQ